MQIFFNVTPRKWMKISTLRHGGQQTARLANSTSRARETNVLRHPCIFTAIEGNPRYILRRRNNKPTWLRSLPHGDLT